MTAEKLSSIYVANMDINLWSVILYSSRGGDGVMEWMMEIDILASYKFHFFRVHNDLVKDPSGNKSIILQNPLKIIK